MPAKDKVPEMTLFSNEQGFKDAIVGVYLSMDLPNNAGNTGLYTNDLSMGLTSVLAYSYDNANASGVGGNGALYNAAYYYNYNDVTLKAEIANIWQALYNNIANINNLLKQIDEKKDLFSGKNYYQLKGEALGLRALFHFDALRYFGQPPLTGANTAAIPYVTTYTSKLTPLSTVSEAAALCIKDLREARMLLANTDTSTINKAVNDPFLSYTQNHLNYFATEGLMARVFLYMGQTDSANYYANAVINSKKFPLITSNVASAGNIIRDRTFSQEHLFSVYSSNLVNINNNLFNSKPNPLALSNAARTTLYATPSNDATDWRYSSWFETNPNSVTVPSKFYQDTKLPYELQGIMPVIRVSEMYYIASECANKNGNIPTATSYLNNVRAARGLSALNAAGINNPDSVSHAIMNEYKKEFISEGQLFFYYKRLNKNLAQVSGTPVTIPADVYVFPLPDAEKLYR